ncbi:hypothetical protein TA3x_002577 [Tundrisphaera sp. TA3]|uniref:hypothetical protein n=1 Tax=Tundrisphaera sp. TA3 TaxID=3435775 RepID=UPI003EBA6D50
MLTDMDAGFTDPGLFLILVRRLVEGPSKAVWARLDPADLFDFAVNLGFPAR